MKRTKVIVVLVALTTLFSCENDVEINAEFEEKTYVLGLLSAQSDTNFVKITKTFLSNTTNAIELAQDPNNLYYNLLTVSLNELNSNKNIVAQFPLEKTIRAKEDGLFSTSRNEVYFTDATIKENTEYSLIITKADGSVVSGETTITDGVDLVEPDVRRRGTISIIDPRTKGFIDERFEFETTDNVGEFSARIIFNYIEINNTDSVTQAIELPLTSILNPSLSESTFVYTFEARKFFDALEAIIPASNNPPSRVIPDQAVNVIIDAADADYTLYRDVNGPIDGLAQTRPEYTNITNGIGLFASRNTNVVEISLSGDTKNYIIATYGDRNNLSQFRGFEF